jgi:hypothetical protein
LASFPYENKQEESTQDESENRIKPDFPVISIDGVNIGKIEAVFGDSLIIKNLIENVETKYKVPRLMIDTITDESIKLRDSFEDINTKYQTSSIEKNWE